MVKLIIHKNEAEQRLDKFLLKYLDQAGPSFLYKMLRKKNITLNGKKAEGSERLAEGDVVTLFLADETIEKFRSSRRKEQETAKPAGIRLDVIYEDDDILLINKPAGLLSQKAAAEDVSLNDAVVEHVRSRQTDEERGAAFTPSICNRLDRNTSGLVTAGKTLAGLQFLSDCFRSRSVDKYYLALVRGKMTERQHLINYLKKDEARNRVVIYRQQQKDADRVETEVFPISGNEELTLVKLKLLTGKTHQLRAVLADLGHPVAGDPKYGDEAFNRCVRSISPFRFQLLHAWQLVFPDLDGRFAHLSGRRFIAPLPAAFSAALKKLELEVPNG